MQYAKRIRDIREDNDLNQTQIAELLKTTQQQYGRYESGQRKLPIDHLITLCRFYNISADYILGLIDEPRKIK
ncbi:MAG: helix-turn-helix transcriptional regulator [Ruminococcus sp.]|nr:helix-turn-helix transcriptional regulator [Ruminococcus sp.]